jgi:hypothetical protein
MMTQQLEVSILAAPLAAIDRRVLSQAWYAALRLGRELPQAAGASGVSQRDPLCPPVRAACVPAPAATQARPPGLARSHATEEPRVGEGSGGGRPRVGSVPRPQQLAGAIEKAFADPALRRATFSIGRANARIVVVMQTRGNRTTLIALCRPHLTEAVARALAQARVALEARGIGIELRERGIRTCS